MKTCRRCKEAKPLSEFSKHAREKDGLCNFCRSCKSAMKREALEKNGDKIREQKRASHHRYKEKNNERTRLWMEENKDRVQAEQRHKYATDEAYREYMLNNALSWPKKNPQAFKAIQKRRDERMKAIGGEVPKDVKRRIWLEQEELCGYCGIRLFEGEYECDHILAVSRNGNNDRDNLCVCCDNCQGSKGHKTLEEWMIIRGW